MSSSTTPPRDHHLNATMTDIPSFATSQLSLLNLELQAELTETQLLTSTHAPTLLQRAGLALVNLHISSQRTGFGGKTLLELSLDPAVGAGELPEHGLRVGDIVGIAEQPKGAERKKDREGMESRGIEGVITKVHRENVTVALDREDVDVPAGPKLWLYVQAHSTVSGLCRLIMYLCMNIVSNSPTTSRTNVSPKP